MSDSVRVVVADDEPDVRLLLTFQLRGAGHEVVAEAANGDEAIARCEEHRPDVIVLDLLMPVRSGFEVIPVVQERWPEVGIIAYTAVAGDFVREQMRDSHVPLVLKSGTPEALLEAIEDLVAARG